MKRILKLAILFLFLFCHCHVLWGSIDIDNPNITLEELISRTDYKAGEFYVLRDTMAREFIKGIQKTDEIIVSGACSNVYLKTFVAWCDRFVPENKGYVIFRAPLHEEKIDKYKLKELFKDTKVNFKPEDWGLTLNRYLNENKIVAVMNTVYLGNDFGIWIYALVPFDGRIFRVKFKYFYSRSLGLKKSSQEYIDSICGVIGRRVQEHPECIVGNDRKFNKAFYDDFPLRLFEFEDVVIKELKIKPHTKTITFRYLIW